MRKRTVNSVFVLGLLMCLGLLAVAARTSGTTATLLLGAAFVWLLPVFLWKFAADKRAALEQRRRDATRLLDLRQQIHVLGQPFRVEAASGVWLPIALMIPAAVFAWLAQRTPIVAIVISVSLALIAFVKLLECWPLIGRPALIIRRDGIDTPTLGFFEWSEIDGMGLTTVTAQYSSNTHTLDLHGIGLGMRRGQVHRAVRLQRKLVPYRRRKDAVAIRLAGTSETPQFIHQLCRDLWVARTGRNAVWVSAMRDEDFQQRRQLSERVPQIRFGGEAVPVDAAAQNSLDQLKEAGGDTLARGAGDGPLPEDAFVEQLWGTKQTHDEWQKKADALARESERAMRRFRLLVAAVLLALIGLTAGWFLT